MVVESFLCPACSEPIPAGRLSCPQCGTVLAAVARRFRAAGEPAVASGAVAPGSIERPWLDGDPGGPAPRASTETSTTAGAGRHPSWDVDVDTDAAGPIPTPVAALLETPPSTWPDEPETVDGQALEAEAREVPTAREMGAEAARPPLEQLQAIEPPRFGLTPSTMPVRPRTILDVLQPVEVRADPGPDDAPMWDAGSAVAQPAAPSPMSAWIPPSPMPETPPEPPARILPRAWDPGAAAAAAAGATAATGPGAGLRRPRLPVVPRARIDEAAGVMVMAGAMGAAIGFILPWSRVVIGARSAGGYFDSWGLAGPGHLVVFALALAALCLAAVPNRIDSWLRTGVVGVALGSLLLGLAWPYAFGPLGAGVGIVLVVVSACLLLLAGLLSTLVQRHAGASPGV